MTISTKYIHEIWKLFDNQEDLQQFIEYCKIPLKKSIKINQHKISTKEFIEITKPRWRHLTDPWFIKNPDVFYIDRNNTEIALWNSFFHQSWFIYIQEIAAWLPARFLDIKAWDIVLDISSAPWWKTCQIWDYLLQKTYLDDNNDNNVLWFVLSNDVNASRQMALFHNINRMWIYNSWITKFNWFSFGKSVGETFDHVLVDAPCSGEWTGFKSDSALKFWKKEEINKIAWTQFQLLVSAIKSTKPWWTIIFSTCTMNPIENENNIKKILEFFWTSIELEDIELLNKSLWIQTIDWNQILTENQASKVARFRPHIQKTWWFFISRFRKKDSLWEKFNPKENKLMPHNPFRIDCWKSLQKKIYEYLKYTFGIQPDPRKHLFVWTKDQIYISSPKMLEIKDKINFERIWIPILKIVHNDTFLPLHSLWTVLWNQSNKNFIEIDSQTAQDYSTNIDISIDKIIWWNHNKWFVIIKWNWYGIGIGKIIDWYVKNKYIR